MSHRILLLLRGDIDRQAMQAHASDPLANGTGRFCLAEAISEGLLS